MLIEEFCLIGSSIGGLSGVEDIEFLVLGNDDLHSIGEVNDGFPLFKLIDGKQTAVLRANKPKEVIIRPEEDLVLDSEV
jgi:hypothetical protein